MNEILLQGCTSRPLAAYLKALGVFRIVGEQLDDGARGAWRNGTFHLTSAVSSDDLMRFFRETWEPSPIIAPWNGGSGFYAKDQHAGIDAIRASESARYLKYKDAILAADLLLKRAAITERPSEDAKRMLILQLRNTLDEDVTRWIDAALLLSVDAVRYPALLGTGGNDGRLEFTNNYMQRVVEVIDPSTGHPRKQSALWLASSLFAEPSPGLSREAIGQFDPPSAGGPNAAAGFEGASPTNPWDYVLMLEGSLLFSTAVTRRSEVSPSRMTYPFIVDSVGSGSGAVALADDATSRGEIWLPLWQTPAGVTEVVRVFSEGRVTNGSRVARNGLEVVKALGQYGVDRGLNGFERYQFMQRNGLAYLATAQGRLRVRREPLLDLVSELERGGGWLNRVRSLARSQSAPASLRSATRSLEDSIFDLGRSGGIDALEELIIAVGELHRVAGRSPALQQELPVLNLTERWAEQLLENGDAEVRIAVALAAVGRPANPLCLNLFPLELIKHKTYAWNSDSTNVVESNANLDAMLAAILLRRARTEQGDYGSCAAVFDSQSPCDLFTWLQFFSGGLDSSRIRSLLFGLALADASPPADPPVQKGIRVPAPLALMKLAVPSRVHWQRTDGSGEDQSAGGLRRFHEVLASLTAGRLDAAVERATLGATIARWTDLPLRRLSGSVIPGDLNHLLATLLVPINGAAARALLAEIDTRDKRREHQ
ncbi:MAG: type I-G CRISPR-associated protein Cas8g1/Csx17 [Thermoanaerobaculia bacterium]